jgi:transcriptional regulator with XRE-family HTH domain
VIKKNHRRSESGEFIKSLRLDSGYTLQKLADEITKHLKNTQFKRKRYSRQTLSFIEMGDMLLPQDKIVVLGKALGIRPDSPKIETLKRLLQRDRRLLAPTTEDQEIVNSIRGVIDPEKPGAIYVIGGKRVPFASSVVQKAVADFLDRDDTNVLAFFYPIRSEDLTLAERPLSFFLRNTEQDLEAVHRFIAAGAKKSRSLIAKQIKFYKIDARKHSDLGIRFALELCHPFVATTLIKPKGGTEPAGYGYFEGGPSSYSFIPLSTDNTDRMLAAIEMLLDRVREGVQEEKIATA